MKKRVKTKIARLKGWRSELHMKAAMLSSIMRDLQVESQHPIEYYLHMIGHLTMCSTNYPEYTVSNCTAIVECLIEELLEEAEPAVIIRATELALQVVSDYRPGGLARHINKEEKKGPIY
jgi:hypothetical protein